MRATAAAALLVAAAAAWLAFAPRQLGGSASYAVVYGTSMLPHFHSDDLVVVRKAGSYRVGDVVLYENRELHRPVLHRVVAIRGGRLVIKGDHNDFLDRPHALPGDVEGKLWLHVPGGGRPLRWIREPLHAAAVAALIALLLVGGGGTGVARRRERAPGSPRRRMASNPSWLPPERSLLGGLVIGGAVALAACILAFVAFRAPSRHSVPIPRLYGQTARLTYAGSVPPGPAYPTGRVHTGDALFLKVVDRVRLALAYRFSAAGAHGIAGRGLLTAKISDGNGWSRSLALAPVRTFTGDSATLTGTLDLRRLQALLRGVVAETGTDAGSYTVTVRPQVRVRGIVDGKPFRDSLSASFPFRLDPIRLAPVGAEGSQPPSFSISRSVPGLRSAPNALSLLGLTLDVGRARTAALALLALSALALAAVGTLLLRVQRAEEESRIRARFGSWLVDVSERPQRSPESVVRVDDFESLLRLADRHERMILDEGGRYVVEDGGTAFVYDVVPDVARTSAGEYGWEDEAPLPADGWT